MKCVTLPQWYSHIWWVRECLWYLGDCMWYMCLHKWVEDFMHKIPNYTRTNPFKSSYTVVPTWWCGTLRFKKKILLLLKLSLLNNRKWIIEELSSSLNLKTFWNLLIFVLLFFCQMLLARQTLCTVRFPDHTDRPGSLLHVQHKETTIDDHWIWLKQCFAFTVKPGTIWIHERSTKWCWNQGKVYLRWHISTQNRLQFW